MMNVEQLKTKIIEPVLKYLEPEIPFSKEAVDLLLMTCAHESLLGEFIHQVGGPAVGIYQMEPDTQHDILTDFLLYRQELGNKVLNLKMSDLPVSNLYNPVFATAMARVHYFRVPEALPSEGSRNYFDYIHDLSLYAKKYYNTHLGAATEKHYYKAFFELVNPIS